MQNQTVRDEFLAADSVLIAVDPGREKCGVAVVAPGSGATDKAQYRVLERSVVARGNVVAHLEEWLERFPGAILVLGDATASRALQSEIAAHWPQLVVEMQDERGSTLEARALYWREKPPRGWRKLWPLSLQMPPEALDDFAAVVLAQRFLERKSGN